MHRTSATHKTAQTTGAATDRDASAGCSGSALAPPAYGIEVVDRKRLETDPKFDQAYHPLPIANGRAPIGSSLPGCAIQPKLMIGPADDKYEQEADRVAQQVVQRLYTTAGFLPPQNQLIQRQALPAATSLARQDGLTHPLAASITQISRKAAGDGSALLLLQRDVEMAYGTWKTEKYEPWVGDGSGEGEEADRRGCAMQLAFHPKDTVDARKIGLVQQLKSTVGGQVEGPENPDSQIHTSQGARNVPITGAVGGGHRIDRGPGEYVPVYGAEVPATSKKQDWTAIKVAIPETQLGYRYKLPGPNAAYTTKAAKLLDTPNRRNAEKNSSMEFETTALAVEGVQANTYYGSVRWGWKTDGAGKHELIPLSAVSESKPSGEFMAAAEQWNKVEGAKGFSLPIQRQPMFQSETEPGESKGQSALRSSLDSSEAGSAFAQSLQSMRGGGAPLADRVRAGLEPLFGADFGGVRVHTDARSDALNRSIQAKAFTTGQDIFFRQGAYEPESRRGQELIAHELTHVVQQTGISVRRITDATPMTPQPL